jgi:hypothetical protein
MANDPLEKYRNAKTREESTFFQWLNENCTKAVSTEEARRITSEIKVPLREAAKSGED